MRHALLGCLAAVLAAADQAPPAAPEVGFTPIRCEQYGDLRFDAAGAPKREHGMLTITLRPVLPPGVVVVGWGTPRLTRVETESGETLAALPSEPQGAPVLRRARLMARRRVMVGDADPAPAEPQPLILRVAPPLRPSFALARVAGTVDLHWRRGEARTVRIAPVVAAPDAPLAIAGVPGGAITISERGDRELSLSMSEELAARLRQLRFEDADGLELRPTGRGSSTTDGATVHRFMVELPRDGALVVEVLPEAITSAIPIALEGVAMPGTGAAPLSPSPLMDPETEFDE